MDLRNATDRELYAEFARRMRCVDKPNERVVFIGPPGGGKGTQAPMLADEFCWCSVSTGDMLRDAISKGTSIGKQAKTLMDRGDLVPDKMVIDLIEEKIKRPECQRGVIFDGFPRTVEQAKALDGMLQEQGAAVSKVFDFQIKDELLTERMVGRRVHKGSGRSYHVKFNPPKVEGVDDVTGEPLIHRIDDSETVIKNRLKQFHKLTDPVIGYYQSLGKIVPVNAEEPISSIYQRIKSTFSRH